MKFPFTPASKQGLAEQGQAESDYFSELSSDFELAVWRRIQSNLCVTPSINTWTPKEPCTAT